MRPVAPCSATRCHADQRCAALVVLLAGWPPAQRGPHPCGRGPGERTRRERRRCCRPRQTRLACRAVQCFAQVCRAHRSVAMLLCIYPIACPGRMQFLLDIINQYNTAGGLIPEDAAEDGVGPSAPGEEGGEEGEEEVEEVLMVMRPGDEGKQGGDMDVDGDGQAGAS